MIRTEDYPLGIPGDEKSHADTYNGFRTLQPFFTNEPYSAVWARVAFQVVKQQYARNPEIFLPNPSKALYGLSLYYYDQGLASLSLWISAFAKDVAHGVKMIESRDAICRRARYYAERKRRGDPWALTARNPRVTNRGVAGSRQRTLDEAMNDLIEGD